MRARRVWAVASIVLLVAGSVAGCAGLDPEFSRGEPSDYLPAVHVTGKMVGRDSPDAEGPLEALRWEASDPRLSGEVTRLWGKGVGFGEPTGGVATAGVTTAAYVVVNADGRWAGTATELDVSNPRFNTATIVLTGEGGHEGWTAYLVTAVANDQQTFTGLLFPGTMPPFPRQPRPIR
jgi:hypothetical protein